MLGTSKFYTAKPILSTQSKEQNEMSFKGRWLLDAGQFTNKMNIWNHRMFTLTLDNTVTTVPYKTATAVL